LDLDDLFCVGPGERTAEDSEVFREDVDDAAVDGAPAGDDAVAGDALLLHAEIVGAVLYEHVPLLEGAFIKQESDTLARRELALGVLGRDALFAAAEASLLALLLQRFDDVFHWCLRFSERCEIPASTAVRKRSLGNRRSAIDNRRSLTDDRRPPFTADRRLSAAVLQFLTLTPNVAFSGSPGK